MEQHGELMIARLEVRHVETKDIPEAIGTNAILVAHTAGQTIGILTAFTLGRRLDGPEPGPLFLYIKTDEIVRWDGELPIDRALHKHLITHREHTIEFLTYAISTISRGVHSLTMAAFDAYTKAFYVGPATPANAVMDKPGTDTSHYSPLNLLEGVHLSEEQYELCRFAAVIAKKPFIAWAQEVLVETAKALVQGSTGQNNTPKN